MQWSKTQVMTRQGMREGVAPLVLSVSRATDIPAFHVQWLMNRIREGYCVWENPFNTAQRHVVSFAQCRVIVFWTKNPKPLFPYLTELEERGFQFYVQYTLNEYTPEHLEPGLPCLEQRLATFQELAERIGKHRVIWRYDPIILGRFLTVESTLERITRVAEVLAPSTEKLTFSFVDWYTKTARTLKEADPLLRPPTEEEMWAVALGLVQWNNQLASPLKLATCAEAIDMSALGIEHNTCIDPELLLRLCPDDQALRALYGAKPKTEQCSLLSLLHAEPKTSIILKDQGQRKLCGCAPSKDIGKYNSCMHLCAYCYANTSPEIVASSMKTRNPKSEQL